MTELTRNTLVRLLAPRGLTLRGGFVPTTEDALPPLPDGRSAAVVWMVGVVGSAFWPQFKASPFYSDGLPDPLDRWSAHIGSGLAEAHGGRALYPFEGPPYYPFQRWADRSEATQASPMMLRMHPEYGLWHAYRFALALPFLAREDALEFLPSSTAGAASVCARCTEQPCLHTCPVDAYTATGFVVQACATHLHAHPDGACMEAGCLARRACPQGVAYRYTQEHAAFHMRAFIAHR